MKMRFTEYNIFTINGKDRKECSSKGWYDCSVNQMLHPDYISTISSLTDYLLRHTPLFVQEYYMMICSTDARCQIAVHHITKNLFCRSGTYNCTSFKCIKCSRIVKQNSKIPKPNKNDTQTESNNSLWIINKLWQKKRENAKYRNKMRKFS